MIPLWTESEGHNNKIPSRVLANVRDERGNTNSIFPHFCAVLAASRCMSTVSGVHFPPGPGAQSKSGLSPAAMSSPKGIRSQENRLPSQGCLSGSVAAFSLVSLPTPLFTRNARAWQRCAIPIRGGRPRMGGWTTLDDTIHRGARLWLSISGQGWAITASRPDQPESFRRSCRPAPREAPRNSAQIRSAANSQVLRYPTSLVESLHPGPIH
ncbi:hypothetical protein LY76DRAFT_420519 [Colletotrichum caudatum]|nr:hypothetical protein LY76DRAFT_420519 [Colletotrichum caudatum]